MIDRAYVSANPTKTVRLENKTFCESKLIQTSKYYYSSHNQELLNI